ncbi:MAG: hypothetical protein FWD36_07885 [Treponema sp.]|nr:hypothetical protein [Treponema sp.]
MSNVNAILDFIKNVVVITLSQLLWLLGVIIIFGLLLYLFARFTRTVYVKSAGEKLDIIVTGWLGVPVHELGHAAFCIIFRHKITDMKLYNPNPTDGTLGYVAHSYNPKSRYQRIGNFFIGIGPILFGTLVLYALLYYVMPGFLEQFSQIIQEGSNYTEDVTQGNFVNLWNSFFASAKSILNIIFNTDNLSNWRFWVFLYLSFCVASHMELSPPDIKGAKDGLITLVITVLIFNFLVMGIELFGLHVHAGSFWQYIKLETYAHHINNFLGILGSLLSYALIISFLNFALSFIALNIYNLIKRRGLIINIWR